MRPYIVTSTDVQKIDESPSQVPSTPLENPFTIKPMKALGDWFEHNVSGRKEFSNSTFLVLDEYSAEYESVMVVCNRGGELNGVFCEFGVAMEISMVCDLGAHSMNGGTLAEYCETAAILMKEAWLGQLGFELIETFR
ncbi:hypothetical protein MMC15_004252 [Xylographa vitiligo]|nr:hypothetical protein [Xylographa vitiligo]